jgi:nicotinate-nucleotide pyrophosphorylase (carboxylating)
MILIKDNHVDVAGGIAQAIRAAQQYLHEKGFSLDIEIETRTLDEVRQAVATGGVRRIMLDNMSLEMMREAVAIIGTSAETEASGGITAQTIRAVAETGVNFISSGALTHSVRSLDISLKITR